MRHNVPSGRNDPVVAPKGADQNTPLDGYWWRFARPTTAFFSSLLGRLRPLRIGNGTDRRPDDGINAGSVGYYSQLL
jgi:hypothetical protein